MKHLPWNLEVDFHMIILFSTLHVTKGGEGWVKNVTSLIQENSSDTYFHFIFVLLHLSFMEIK